MTLIAKRARHARGPDRALRNRSRARRPARGPHRSGPSPRPRTARGGRRCCLTAAARLS